MGSSIILIIVLALIVTFVSLFTFRFIPHSWVCDYNSSIKTLSPYKHIYKLVIVFTFILSIIFFSLILNNKTSLLNIFCDIILLIVLLQICISDLLYKIIPDQHIIAIGLLSLYEVSQNYVGFHIKGVLAGILPFLLLLVFSALVQGTELIGFGDIKLMAVLGFYVGTIKIFYIYILTGLLSGIFSFFLLLFAIIGKFHQCPHYISLAPFICFSFILINFFV